MIRARRLLVVPRWMALAPLCALLTATLARAQSGALEVSASIQAVTGDRAWLFQGRSIEPAAGISWRQPGTRLGTTQVDAQLVGGPEHPQLGRAALQAQDWKRGTLTWSLGAGDLTFTPGIAEYRFANLTVPAVSFFGGGISARSERTSFSIASGQTTLLRDLFGNDPIRLDQSIVVGSARQRLTDHVDIMVRASRVRTGNLNGFGAAVASSDQAGAGVRYSLSSTVQFVADGSYVSYATAAGMPRRRDGSGLLGASWLLSRGWLQFNVTRFSPGELPTINLPLRDRQGLFAAGEYRLGNRARVFSGWDSFRTNLDFQSRPGAEVAAGLTTQLLQSPLSFGARRFVGLHVGTGGRSSLVLRVEQGDRLLRPLAGGFDTTSDTGSQSAEWQATAGPVRTFVRYARRQNVDHAAAHTSFTEHDASAQIFVTASKRTELFATGGVVDTSAAVDEPGATGQSHMTWQAGGGLQQQAASGRLWLRAEGTVTGHRDSLQSLLLPQQSWTVGFNGQLTPRTRVAFNAFLFHSPSVSPTRPDWATRSTLRVVQTIPTGTEAAASLSSAVSAKSSASGAVAGFVYEDWNRNGVADPDESPLKDIRITVAGRTAATGRDGRLRFSGVPVGLQRVALDLGTLPVDFDPPDAHAVDVLLAKGASPQFRFGLVPLGSIRGTVELTRDAEGRGPDPASSLAPDMVVVLDGGTRSELVKNGRFRFDAVRSGEHTVTLLQDSLSPGTQIADAAEVRIAITKSRPAHDVTFVVAQSVRGEVRRVFSPRRGEPPPVSDPSRARGPAAPPAVPSATATGVGPRRHATRASMPSLRGGRGRVSFSVQIAALRDELRAKQLAREVQAAGFPATIVESGASRDARIFRVRVGRYEDRAGAVKVAEQLSEFGSGERLWLVEQTIRLEDEPARR